MTAIDTLPTRLLATRARDEEDLYRVHRELLADKPPEGSSLAALRRLAQLAPATIEAEAREAAELVRAHRLPFLQVESALGQLSEPVALAIVESVELDELLSRLVLLQRRGLIKGRVRRAIAKRLTEASVTEIPYRKLEAVARKADLDRELAGLVIRLGAPAGGALVGHTAVLVDVSYAIESEAGFQLAARVLGSIDRALDADDRLDLVLFAERATKVPLPRGATPGAVAEHLAWRASDLGRHTSVGSALTYLDDAVERLVIVTDGTENRPPRLATALIERRARLGRDPAIVLVSPHDAARQLAVDLEAAAIGAEVFTIDRWGFGHAALIGALVAHRGSNDVEEILGASEAS